MAEKNNKESAELKEFKKAVLDDFKEKIAELATKLDEAKELLKDEGTPMPLNEFLERFHPKVKEEWEKYLKEAENGRS